MSKMKPSSREESLDHYLSLSYPYELVRDEDGSFVASHPGLIGCLAQGETADEAIEALDRARRAWLEVRFEDGLPIPEPLEEDDYSGKILLRIPPSLHAALARLAQQQDAISLTATVGSPGAQLRALVLLSLGAPASRRL